MNKKFEVFLINFGYVCGSYKTLKQSAKRWQRKLVFNVVFLNQQNHLNQSHGFRSCRLVMDKFVIVNGGTQKQRWLVEDISWWFCDKYFNRFKSFNIEIDLEKIEE